MYDLNNHQLGWQGRDLSDIRLCYRLQVQRQNCKAIKCFEPSNAK